MVYMVLENQTEGSVYVGQILCQLSYDPSPIFPLINTVAFEGDYHSFWHHIAGYCRLVKILEAIFWPLGTWDILGTIYSL